MKGMLLWYEKSEIIAQLKEDEWIWKNRYFNFWKRKIKWKRKQTRIYVNIFYTKQKEEKTNRINVIRSICFYVEEHQYCKITRRKKRFCFV
jgi:hypothetical protein